MNHSATRAKKMVKIAIRKPVTDAGLNFDCWRPHDCQRQGGQEPGDDNDAAAQQGPHPPATARLPDEIDELVSSAAAKSFSHGEWTP
jgi:hypothetical protein